VREHPVPGQRGQGGKQPRAGRKDKFGVTAAIISRASNRVHADRLK
jgi:hypothetical protein